MAGNLVVLLAPGCLAIQFGVAWAEEKMSYGEGEYLNSCAACHGLHGKGDGPLVDFLNKTPADLTLLSKKNGGEYPYWRSDVLSPTRFLIKMARTADLIVTGSPEIARDGDPRRSINLGGLLLHAGRPVLVPASGSNQCAAKRAPIAWKGGREARRAVADAIPLLECADEVVVAMDDAHRLADFAKTMQADLVVSGTYGISRLGEWVFGGVTRSLLNEIGLTRLTAS